MENSEITIEPEDELTALAQLEEEEEIPKKVTLEELFEKGEEEPTELEELFPDAPYTVYYQDV